MVFSTNSTKMQITLQDGENNLEFLVNDLSIDGQFTNLAAFRESINRIMLIRGLIKKYGKELYCHRNMAHAEVSATMTMPQAVNHLDRNECRALMQWLTKHGPFWEDARNHGPNEWFEWNGDIVTDSAVGETAWCCLHGIHSSLVSLVPSTWRVTPIKVDWKDATEKKSCEIGNYWEPATIEEILQQGPAHISSWKQLQSNAEARFPELTFTKTTFSPLKGLPFFSSAAHRIVVILDLLNKLKTCFNGQGARTVEGHELYRDFFTGKKENGGRGSLFSDSSDTEKNDFESELTFKHPNDALDPLFCPWHGKIQTPQLRVHFSYPIRAKEPLYIVYIGEKITKN